MKPYLRALAVLALTPFILAGGPGGFVGLPHIVGGKETARNVYPHQVALEVTPVHPNPVFICGGSLITREWVLSAAHCVDKMVKIVATLGAHDLTVKEQSKQTINVAKWIKHDKYTGMGDNDIALLKLQSPATLNQHVQTIRLPTLSIKDKYYAGETITIIGWGRYKDTIPERSPVLRSVEAKVLSNAECSMKLGFGLIKDIHICSDGQGGRGGCTGDSGGPMIAYIHGEKTVIGTVSFGTSKECERGNPTVFARVDKYLEWIAKITGLPI